MGFFGTLVNIAYHVVVDPSQEERDRRAEERAEEARQREQEARDRMMNEPYSLPDPDASSQHGNFGGYHGGSR